MFHTVTSLVSSTDYKLIFEVSARYSNCFRNTELAGSPQSFSETGLTALETRAAAAFMQTQPV